MLWTRRVNITNMPAPHKLIFKYNEIKSIRGPIKVFFGQIRKVNSKIYVDKKWTCMWRKKF